MSFYIIQCICFLEFYINIMLMRKFLSFFFVMAFYVVGAYAQVLVQGQPHPFARNISTKQESQLRADASFTFDDIQYWVGNGSNKAALVIEWHDGNRPDAMVWGYRWDGEATGHDMIVAIAQADPRLVLLTQYTGWMGYTIDGIGYGESILNISYDLEGAKSSLKMRLNLNLLSQIRCWDKLLTLSIRQRMLRPPFGKGFKQELFITR